MRDDPSGFHCLRCRRAPEESSDSDVGGSKRRRLNPPADGGAAGDQPSSAANGTALDSEPPLTSSQDLQTVLNVLVVAVASKNDDLLQQLLSSLAPAVLADVVLCNMQFMPSVSPPEDGPLPAAPAQAQALPPPPPLPSALMRSATPPALQQPQAPPKPMQQPTLPPPPRVPVSAPPMAVSGAQQPSQPAAAMRPPPRAAPPPLRPSPLPLPLPPTQAAYQGKRAVQRILAGADTPLKHFRQHLLTRLVSKSPPSSGLLDVLLQYMLSDFHGRDAYSVAVQLLYSLFVVHSKPPPLPPAAVTKEDPDALKSDSKFESEFKPAPQPAVDGATAMDIDSGDAAAGPSPAVEHALDAAANAALDSAATAASRQQGQVSVDAALEGAPSAAASGLSNTPYEAVLMQLLDGVAQVSLGLCKAGLGSVDSAAGWGSSGEQYTTFGGPVSDTLCLRGSSDVM